MDEDNTYYFLAIEYYNCKIEDNIDANESEDIDLLNLINIKTNFKKDLNIRYTSDNVPFTINYDGDAIYSDDEDFEPSSIETESEINTIINYNSETAPEILLLCDLIGCEEHEIVILFIGRDEDEEDEDEEDEDEKKGNDYIIYVDNRNTKSQISIFIIKPDPNNILFNYVSNPSSNLNVLLNYYRDKITIIKRRLKKNAFNCIYLSINYLYNNNQNKRLETKELIIIDKKHTIIDANYISTSDGIFKDMLKEFKNQPFNTYNFSRITKHIEDWFYSDTAGKFSIDQIYTKLINNNFNSYVILSDFYASYINKVYTDNQYIHILHSNNETTNTIFKKILEYTPREIQSKLINDLSFDTTCKNISTMFKIIKNFKEIIHDFKIKEATDSNYKALLDTVSKKLEIKINDSIITYLKINNTGERYNKMRYAIRISNDKTNMILKYNDDFKVQYTIENNSEIDIKMYNDLLKPLPNYLIGKYTKIFLPNEDNEFITENMDNILNQTNPSNHMQPKPIFILGYGSSGAGKTSNLIYYRGGDQEGILPILCRKIIEKNDTNNFKTLVLRVREFSVYTESSKNKSEYPEYIPYTFILENGLLVLKEDTDISIKHPYRFNYDLSEQNLKIHNITVRGSKFYVQKGTTLGKLVIFLVDVDRLVKATTNNPQSSRSHVLVFVDIIFKDEKKNVNLIVGDFAGIENTFDCTSKITIDTFSKQKNTLLEDKTTNPNHDDDNYGYYDNEPIFKGQLKYWDNDNNLESITANENDTEFMNTVFKKKNDEEDLYRLKYGKAYIDQDTPIGYEQIYTSWFKQTFAYSFYNEEDIINKIHKFILKRIMLDPMRSVKEQLKIKISEIKQENFEDTQTAKELNDEIKKLKTELGDDYNTRISDIESQMKQINIQKPSDKECHKLAQRIQDLQKNNESQENKHNTQIEANKLQLSIKENLLKQLETRNETEINESKTKYDAEKPIIIKRYTEILKKIDLEFQLRSKFNTYLSTNNIDYPILLFIDSDDISQTIHKVPGDRKPALIQNKPPNETQTNKLLSAMTNYRFINISGNTNALKIGINNFYKSNSIKDIEDIETENDKLSKEVKTARLFYDELYKQIKLNIKPTESTTSIPDNNLSKEEKAKAAAKAAAKANKNIVSKLVDIDLNIDYNGPNKDNVINIATVNCTLFISQDIYKPNNMYAKNAETDFREKFPTNFSTFDDIYKDNKNITKFTLAGIIFSDKNKIETYHKEDATINIFMFINSITFNVITQFNEYNIFKQSTSLLNNTAYTELLAEITALKTKISLPYTPYNTKLLEDKLAECHRSYTQETLVYDNNKEIYSGLNDKKEKIINLSKDLKIKDFTYQMELKKHNKSIDTFNDINIEEKVKNCMDEVNKHILKNVYTDMFNIHYINQIAIILKDKVKTYDYYLYREQLKINEEEQLKINEENEEQLKINEENEEQLKINESDENKNIKYKKLSYYLAARYIIDNAIQIACNNRKNEGIWINSELQKIKYAIEIIVKSKNLEIFYNYNNECFENDGYKPKNLNIINNKDIENIINNNIFINSIISNLYKTDGGETHNNQILNKKIDIVKNIIVCIYCVFNYAYKVIEEYPRFQYPYLNIDNLKKISFDKDLNVSNLRTVLDNMITKINKSESLKTSELVDKKYFFKMGITPAISILPLVKYIEALKNFLGNITTITTTPTTTITKNEIAKNMNLSYYKTHIIPAHEQIKKYINLDYTANIEITELDSYISDFKKYYSFIEHAKNKKMNGNDFNDNLNNIEILVNKLIEHIDVWNSTTPMGSLEFLDSIAKLNTTNYLCTLKEIPNQGYNLLN